MAATTRSSGNHCVVVGCSNNYRKRRELAAELCELHHQPRRLCGCELFRLHRFPADEDQRRLWIARVNRKDFIPSASSRVCSEHFICGERTDTNPTPMLKLGYQRKVKVGRRRIVKEDYVPTKKRKLCTDGRLAAALESGPGTSSGDPCTDRMLAAPTESGPDAITDDSVAVTFPGVVAVSWGEINTLRGAPVRLAAVAETQTEGQIVCKQEAGTQWVDQTTVDHAYTTPLQFGFLRVSVRAQMSASDILFYTGVSEDVFQRLVACLRKTPLKPSHMQLDDQLLLTLMRLRLGLLYKDLAWRFAMSPSCVCKTFNSILHSLKQIMDYVVVWLPKSRIQSSMPDSFIKNGYENTTCIFDCTEVALQRPKKQKARAQTYSSYKAQNTVKFLTVIAPNGFIMYVSSVYGGRASDKFIVKNCGVQEYLVRGDEIMADRGFTLDPYLEAQGVKLNMPAFTRGKDQLSEQEVTKTRRIASVRVHVERAINRIKSYRIFKSALSIKCKKTVDAMVFVCAGLCNLKKPLIAEKTCGTSPEHMLP